MRPSAPAAATTAHEKEDDRMKTRTHVRAGREYELVPGKIEMPSLK
jgi:hypothetical protein